MKNEIWIIVLMLVISFRIHDAIAADSAKQNASSPTAIASIQASLFSAVKSSNIEEVKAALANGANINASEELNDGEPEITMAPLHRAVAMQVPNQKIIELLLANGAHVNAKDGIGWTPLHWAAQNDWPDIVILLISKGADVNAKSNSGDTPLQVAGSKTMADLLRKYDVKK